MFRYEKKREETIAQPVKNRLSRIKFLSSLSLQLERFTIALWRPFCWILFFVSLWILQIPASFGITAEYAVFFIFVIGLWFLITRSLQNLIPIDEHILLRRIEQQSNVSHRPFSQIDDTLANKDAHNSMRQTLWLARLPILQKHLSSLRPASPRAVLPSRDPYALRAAVIVFAICAFVIAGSHWQERLRAGLFPFSIQITGLNETGTQLTITPPEYTRLPTRIISGIHKGEPQPIAQGSEIKAQTSSLFGTPKMIMGETIQPFEKLDDRNFGIVSEIENGESIKIKQMGRSVLSYPYTLIIDTPPVINVSEEHSVTEYSSMRFPITLQDDYGVRDLHMRMELSSVVEDAPFGEPYKETRAVMTAGGKDSTEITPIYDLTSHVWAGLPVTVTFTAEDAIGQSGEIIVNAVLPEREFKHPIAIELIELRKTLAWNYQAAPEDMIDTLISLMGRPADYNGDLTVFLSMRSAASRLRYSPGTDATAKALIDLFWKIAIHLEDGDLNLARERLLQAQRELEQALNDPNLSAKEKARLLDNLQKAMSEYLQELGRELQKRLAEGEQMPMINQDMLEQMIDPESMAQFFDQLQSETLNGHPDKARELLSQLDRLMDMLDPSMSMGMPRDMQMMQDGVNELQELIRRQEELLDQTRKQSDEASNHIEYDYGQSLDAFDKQQFEFGDLPPPPNDKNTPRSSKPAIDTSANKVEQEALRYVLGQLMLEADGVLDKIPETMGLAEREMRRSSNALGENNPYSSIPHQEKAIEYLREAMDDLSQQMMARMEQMTGMRIGKSQSDPLGRQFGNDQSGNRWFNGSRVQIPDEAERKRAEEILKQLREKSGEFDRSKEELEYFRRLLKQF